jgi:MFS transporter, Spinster family, sphingosine-1-phosphate transporter
VIRSPRVILALLTLLNFVNYLDRFLIAAVAPKIQEELKLGDGPIGDIMGAFMLGYFVTSPAFGWLGDRYPRKGLIAAGVLAWSVATAASGSATSFATLYVARIFVGIGEASYASLSPTIIDDMSSPEKKNRDLAIFYAATPIGSALGFMLGGWLQESVGWRAAFYIAGGPGVLLALLTLFIAEPSRTHSTKTAPKEVDASPYRSLLREPPYLFAVAGYALQTFALGGFTNWAPTFLERKFSMSLKDANFWFGAVAVVTGFLGTAAGGWIADRMKGDRVRACLRICTWSSVIAAPLALVTVIAPTPITFFVAIALCELGLFLSVSPINAAVMHSVPPAIRANAMAFSIFAIHLLGDWKSPQLIGIISDRSGGGARGLQLGMYMLPVAFALSVILWALGARARSLAPRNPA